MGARNFRELLAQRQKEKDTLVCVGLDPLAEKLPDIVRAASTSTWAAVLLWMREVVDATADFASMFKPQHAHWEAIDGGPHALQALIAHIHLKHPEVPVFLDCKRGDIDRTQKQYGHAHFTLEGVDGMNYNGYMGRDTLKALVDANRPGVALVGLGRTSNPDAWEVQDQVLADGRHFWEFMVERLHAWSREFGVNEDAGVVMGAAHKDPSDPEKVYSWHLTRGREIYGNDMWDLIPGIGTQKGFVEETVRGAFRGPGTIAINSSSGIIFASCGPDFPEAAAREAEKLRNQIRAAGGTCS